MSSNGNSTLSLLCSAFGPFSTPTQSCNEMNCPLWQSSGARTAPPRCGTTLTVSSFAHTKMMTMDPRGRGRCPIALSSSRQSQRPIGCSWTRDVDLTTIGRARCLRTTTTMMVTTMMRKSVILWRNDKDIILVKIGRISSVLCSRRWSGPW